MTNNIKESLERELRKIESEEILSPAYRKKKLIAYAVRTAIMVGIYIYFWDFVWFRWTLLVYIPLNLLGLGLIFGSKHFLDKKIDALKQKIEEVDALSQD
ncbi:MAG: hypothetical protein AB8B69_23170 [Chitinophagales bacterium]